MTDKNNRKLFENMAASFDTPPRIALAAAIRPVIASQLADSQEHTLLDYGCGTGLISLPLAPLVKELILLDTAAAMLQVVNEKLQQLQLKNARTMQGDFTNELPQLQVDKIVVSLVLLHVPETAKLLQAFYRLLRPQGQVIIVDFDKNPLVADPRVHNGFDQLALREELAAAGFGQVSSRTFYQGEKLFMNQDASLFIAIGSKA